MSDYNIVSTSAPSTVSVGEAFVVSMTVECPLSGGCGNEELTISSGAEEFRSVVLSFNNQQTQTFDASVTFDSPGERTFQFRIGDEADFRTVNVVGEGAGFGNTSTRFVERPPSEVELKREFDYTISISNDTTGTRVIDEATHVLTGSQLSSAEFLGRHDVELEPGQEDEYVVTVDLGDTMHLDLSTGNYTVEVWLHDEQGQGHTVATSDISIVEVQDEPPDIEINSCRLVSPFEIMPDENFTVVMEVTITGLGGNTTIPVSVNPIIEGVEFVGGSVDISPGETVDVEVETGNIINPEDNSQLPDTGEISLGVSVDDKSISCNETINISGGVGIQNFNIEGGENEILVDYVVGNDSIDRVTRDVEIIVDGTVEETVAHTLGPGETVSNNVILSTNLSQGQQEQVEVCVEVAR